MIHKITTEANTSHQEMSSNSVFNITQFQNFSLVPIITHNLKCSVDDIFYSIGIRRDNFLIARGSYTKVKNVFKITILLG